MNYKYGQLSGRKGFSIALFSTLYINLSFKKKIEWTFLKCCKKLSSNDYCSESFVRRLLCSYNNLEES